MIRTFSDHKKQLHSLNLDTVLVDGMRCHSVQAIEQYVQFELEDQSTVTCELAQFWHEVAGPDLSAQEAGLLLAECLVRQVVIQRTSSTLHEVMCLLTRVTALPAEIPSSAWLTTRLDPLAQQAMSAYDGTPEVTDMLARILQREPETIQMWACQLGMDAPLPDIKVETEPLLAVEPLAEAEARERFFWSSERLQQLEQTLATCSAPTVAERARQIAASHDWPVQAVRSKLYEMQRPRRAGQPVAREAEGAEAEQEGDQHADQREAIPV